jgi:hypothetical protein
MLWVMFQAHAFIRLGAISKAISWLHRVLARWSGGKVECEWVPLRRGQAVSIRVRLRQQTHNNPIEIIFLFINRRQPLKVILFRNIVHQKLQIRRIIKFRRCITKRIYNQIRVTLFSVLLCFNRFLWRFKDILELHPRLIRNYSAFPANVVNHETRQKRWNVE